MTHNKIFFAKKLEFLNVFNNNNSTSFHAAVNQFVINQNSSYLNHNCCTSANVLIVYANLV